MFYKSPGGTSDVREEDPCLCAFDCFFPILDQSSATPEARAKVRSTTQRRGSTLKPSAVSERFTIWTVQRPMFDQRIAQLWPCIATIRKDMAWFRGFMLKFPKHAHGPVTILNVGGMNTERQQIAAGIDHDVALAALDLLAGVVSGNGRVFRCFHALTVDHQSTRR